MPHAWKFQILNVIAVVIAWIGLILLGLAFLLGFLALLPLILLTIAALICIYGAGAVQEFVYDLKRKLRR